MRSNYFFIIGAQRCGTTFLYHQLDGHPEICMAKPVKPEPKFFLNPREYEKGKAYYIAKYFRNCTQQIRGEKSTSYIEFEGVLKKIKEFFPDSKIVVVLRNPVMRAISNYMFSYNNGFETRSLEEVFLYNKKNDYHGELPSVSPFDYLRRGEYIRYLRKVYDYFDPSRIRVAIFEKMIFSREYIQSIYEFVGADKTVEPDCFNKDLNASDPEYYVSQKVYDVLKSHFLPYNEELENFLSISLDFWK